MKHIMKENKSILLKKEIIKKFSNDFRSKIYTILRLKLSPMLQLENYVPQKGNILDLGCGSGLLFLHLNGRTKEVIGVDLSKNLLSRAKQVGTTIDANVSLILADADYLPFPGNLFCAVFAFTVLQNMPHPLKTLVEAKRVLAPEAQMVVSGLKKSFSLDRFVDLLNQAGFYLNSLKDDKSLKCFIAFVSHTKC